MKRIFSGGDRSFACTTKDVNDNYDARIFEYMSKKPQFLQNASILIEFITYHLSYFRAGTQIESMSISLAQHCASIKKDETVDLTLMSCVETLFKSLSCINGSFLQSNDTHICCSSKNHGLNIADAEIAFSHIRKMENENLKNVVS